MTYKVEQVAEALKNARKAQGISQRELSKLVSVPQSHISKIERYGVDLRLSSLIEIARALDLEVELVPRKHLSAVRTIIKSSTQNSNNELSAAKNARELQRLQNTTTELVRQYPAVKAIAQLQSRIKELSQFEISGASVSKLKNIAKSLDAFAKDSTNLSIINEAILQLQQIQNQIVNEQDEQTRLNNTPSMYTLDDEDNV